MSEQLRVEELIIERWGRASGFGSVPLADDFIVLFGDNESGKTSVATALAWLLAGPGDQKLLRKFGSEGDQLGANLRGQWGTDRLRISATAKVPKPKASGQPTDKYFQVTIGERQVTRSQLTDRLHVGDFDTYKRFYWVESLRVADGSRLTDDLSVQTLFGGIDPLERSAKLTKQAHEELTERKRKEPDVWKDSFADYSAVSCSEARTKLDICLKSIADASGEMQEIDCVLQQLRCDRNRIRGQLDSVRRATGAHESGQVEEWRSRVRERDAADPPTSAERKLYKQSSCAERLIGRLAEAEQACESLRTGENQVSVKPRRYPRIVALVIAAVSAGLVFVLAAFIDLRLGWRLIASGIAATAMLVWDHFSRRGSRKQREMAEKRRQKLLKAVCELFSDVECARISPAGDRERLAPSEMEAVPLGVSGRDVELTCTEIEKSGDAQERLEAIRKQVEHFDDALTNEHEALRGLKEAVEYDDAALQQAKAGDPDALSRRISGLEAELNALAGDEGSIDERIELLQGQVGELRRSSNEVSGNRLRHGELTQTIRDKIVRGLGHQLAAKLLHDTAERYRKERQPELLKQTERLIPKVAGWTSITVDPQSSGERGSAKSGEVLLVDGPHGEHPAGQMSFGARSLLFLMLRLARVRQQGEDSGVRLPVILDDVLVGLDDRRAEECMSVLASFSKHNQVILLTCHSSTTDLARGAGGAVVDFPPRPSRVGT